jgi:hypothetical protein
MNHMHGGFYGTFGHFYIDHLSIDGNFVIVFCA